jgi:MFS family permease
VTRAIPGARGQRAGTAPTPVHGLRRNWFQFSLLALLTMMVGATIGVERVALPPLAEHAFGVTSVLYTVAFISAFGVVKATMNLVSGWLSDRHGRRLLLLAGWAFAVPYALLIIFAQNWIWVLVANMFLGVNQALTWTMSVTAMIDLVGPVNRGVAVGINEATGYVGVMPSVRSGTPSWVCAATSASAPGAAGRRSACRALPRTGSTSRPPATSGSAWAVSRPGFW